VARAGHGEIHVGYAPTPTVELLPRALHAFQNVSPQVKVNLHDLSNEEMLRGLRERKLDLVLMVRSDLSAVRDIAFEELIRYPMRLAVSPRHPLARTRRPVALTALGSERFHVYTQAEYPEYHRFLHRLLKAAGQALQVAGEHDSATSLMAAVEAGRGIALVPSCMSCLAGPRLRLLELKPAPEPLSVGVAYLNKTDLKPAATQFLATLRELKQ
jgi:DNA-binding transcriptional LysR family regulator